jgi:7-cyano-7-deazaguanine synthase
MSCLFVDYGQAAAEAETRAAACVAEHYQIPLRQLTLTGLSFADGEIAGRNAFLLHVAMLSIRGCAGTVAIGIHAGTTYRDCTPRFIEIMRSSYEFHSSGKLMVIAPFVDRSKGEIFDIAQDLHVPINLTYSCEASNIPCGRCRSCRDRESLLARA